MRPCNTAVINDDYQDARVLSETNDYVELEVIHYPFNTNAEAIEGNRRWQEQPEQLRGYLRPGITTNWDDTMRSDLLAGLQKAGIKRERLTDKQVVEKVSQWLLSHGKYRYMFGTYFVHFPKGQAKVFPGLEDAFRREKGNTDLTFQQHLQHEVFGKGMFYNKSYGSCTSTATYLTTGLRAVGIPTRMILAIPLVDSTDPKQIQMIQEHISNHQVRRTLLRGLPPDGFSAHTFNEVYVGGRWRRLNYEKLGQNTYGQGAMGMLTHIHTFNDLSEAGLTETWGWRYGRGERDSTFRGSNPYRTTEVSDRFGIHSKVKNPPVEEAKDVVITKAYWFFSDQRAKSIPAKSVEKNEDGHILVHVDVSFDDLNSIYPKLGTEFLLTAEGKPTVRAQAERGFWNQECYIRIPAGGFAKMVTGAPYQLTPTNQTSEYRWKVNENVRITKYSEMENPPVEDAKDVVITKAYWFFSDQRAKRIPEESVEKNKDGHILVHVEVSFNDLKTIYPKLGTEFLLTAEGKPTIRAQAERGYWNQECYIRIPADGFSKMVSGVPYQLMPTNQTSEFRWKVSENVRITKN